MIHCQGKKGIVLGVGNNKSIAWHIAESLKKCGAEVALTYLPDERGRFKKNVEKLADQIESPFIQKCDVSVPSDIQELFAKVESQWGEIDFLVHSLAFAKQDDLGGAFSATSAEGFLKAQEISAYSLLPLSAAAAPLMKNGGSILAMSYIGSVRAVPSYNVMGPAKAALESSVRYLARELGEKSIRVNCISAGPIKTLSAMGIQNFAALLDGVAQGTALKRNVELEEVASTASFLCSPFASGITAQTIYVDCGYNMMGN